jgi:hypothetical protein
MYGAMQDRGSLAEFEHRFATAGSVSRLNGAVAVAPDSFRHDKLSQQRSWQAVIEEDRHSGHDLLL